MLLKKYCQKNQVLKYRRNQYADVYNIINDIDYISTDIFFVK